MFFILDSFFLPFPFLCSNLEGGEILENFFSTVSSAYQ